MTFGYYLFPDHARYFAAAAVLTFMAVNYFGVKKTANTTKAIVFIVLLVLLTIVGLTLKGNPSLDNLQPLIGSNGFYGILQSAGIWFFAFAGYSRIATLGEEIKDPEKSIPRAIMIGLGLTLVVYAAVVMAALSVVGPAVLSQSNAPLVTAVTEAGLGQWQWLVKVGSTLATLGVLLSLMTGISRTLFAMAADRKLPLYLAKVHPIHKVPHRAEITVGLLLTVIVLLVDVRSAIGFSAFTVLLYYAVTNMSAYTLRASERLFSRKLAVLGFVSCLVLAFTLPIKSVIIGSLVMLFGVIVYSLQERAVR